MLKDKPIIWVLEYILGGIFVIGPLACTDFCRTCLADAHLWATGLFIVCLGVILISCASSMRQRLLLADRIDKLAKQFEHRCAQP